MRVKIVNGRSGLWYENLTGKVFEVREENNVFKVVRASHETYLSEKGLYEEDLVISKPDCEVYSAHGEKMHECLVCSRYSTQVDERKICSVCSDAMAQVKYLAQFEKGRFFIRSKTGDK